MTKGQKERSSSQERNESRSKYGTRITRSTENNDNNEEVSSPKTTRRRSGIVRNQSLDIKSKDIVDKNGFDEPETNNEKLQVRNEEANSCEQMSEELESITGRVCESNSSLKKEADEVALLKEDAAENTELKNITEDMVPTDCASPLPASDSSLFTIKLEVSEQGIEETSPCREEVEKEEGSRIETENEIGQIDKIDNMKSLEDISMKEVLEETYKIEKDYEDYEEDGDDEKSSERRERRKAKSRYNNMENDDLERMLKWKNGIGSLPGSNLKFRKSDIGALEVITPSSDEEDREGGSSTEKKGRKRRAALKGTRRLDAKSPTMELKAGVPKVKKENNSPKIEKRKRKDRKKKKFADDELLKCETCGCYGLISEFRSSGRFCSQRCVGAYASKRRAEMIAQQFANGERPLPKSGRRPVKKRKMDSKDSSPGKSPVISPMLGNDKRKFFSDDATIYYGAAGYDKEFDWDAYLRITQTRAVALNTFVKEYSHQELYPENSVHFKPTMKLECVDPRHQSIFCVVSVVEVQGARMRLHFDGWSESYDFWINCDSYFLRPCGWCERNGQKLDPPRGMKPESFSWLKYLQDTGCEAAPSYLFPDDSTTTHGFRTNMKLEAIDRKNPDLICVASVANVVGNHFLIHFDEWDDQYDYWCKDGSPYIHPIGWCSEIQVPLVPPTDEMVNKFIWEDYLRETNTIAAPKNIFRPRNEPVFVTGTKLEAVDPRNPSLVRVSTVCETEEFRVKIHSDGWDSIYDYWYDTDSVDLHPVNWCKRTGHILETPPAGKEYEEGRLCGTRGCRGIGHIKGLKYTTHHTSFGCPYTPQNIHRSTSPVVDRLAANSMVEESSINNRIHRRKNASPIEDVLPDSTTKGDPGKPRAPGRLVGRPSKKHGGEHRKFKGGVRRRKRRGSDEVSSSTSPATNINNQHSNSYLTKPIPPTHRPAGQSNMMYHQQRITPSKAIPWTQDDVAEFVKRIGYEDYAPSFKDHQIDGQALLLLSQADLVHHLKFKLGPALKIYSEISKL